MTDRSKLLALASEVEILSEADTMVDAEIALAIGYANCRPRTTADYPKTPIENQYGHGFFPPAYTGSLDAAMKLLPEGAIWDVDATAPECGIDWCVHVPGKTRRDVMGTNEKPALALCAAALRAQAEALA